MYKSYKNIVENLPIEVGDCILVSSDITNLGKLAFEKEEEFDANILIDQLQQKVGKEGTLLFPTYNWDFCGGAKFDYKKTRSKTGALSSIALKRSDFKRTKHPLYSFAVWGKYKEYLCNLENTDSFGNDSPFAFLHKHNGKELFIDVDYQNSFTFLHYVEENVGCLPYRYIKTFTAPYVDETGNESTRSYTMFVRTLELDTENDINPIGEYFQKESAANSITVNEIPFTTLDLNKAYQIVKDDIINNKSKNLVHYKGQNEENFEGKLMYERAGRIFPICRSITGNGVRKTLEILKQDIYAKNLFSVYEVPSGTQVFDWTVPKEWNINAGWIKDKDGKTIIDFENNNLHIMGYSTPIHKKIPLCELLDFVYTEENQPNVIPYITSYYKERFGFCMTENMKQQLLKRYDQNDEFEICIDSTLKHGSLTYAEMVIPSTDGCKDEVLFSTYTCHPSMANNECSGPVLAVQLANYITCLAKRHFTYRFVFIPETIGSIAYLSQNLEHLKKHTIAGFNLTCVGDDNAYSYLKSAYGNTLADKVLQNVLHFSHPEFKTYPHTQSGSDERRYNSPGVEMPVVCFSRSLYGMYPEYHTSADNMEYISAKGLQGSYDVMVECINALEHNTKDKIKCFCEPQLGKRGLYPTLSRKGQYDEIFKLVNYLEYTNGNNDLIDISNLINVPVKELISVQQKIEEADLIERQWR